MSDFARGDHVVVTAGLSKDRRGEIVERWYNFDRRTPAYKVRFPGELHCCVIRADFLARVQENAS